MAQSEKVIISVELRDKGVKAGLDSAAKASEQAANATRKLTAAEKDENYWASKAGEAEALRAVKTNIAKGRAKELAIETINLTNATKQGKTQTGLNNAILVEAGRAASDFQYGMQGMANNIGQLTTLMGQHIQTQGGFVGSMKELGKSFFGIQGLLIGVQLFISFLPKLEKMYKESKDSLASFNDELEDLGKHLGDEAGNFETYISKLQSTSTSQEEYKKTVSLLNDEFPDYIDSLKKSGLSLEDVKNKTDEAKEANDLYRDSIIEVAMSEAAKAEIQKESAKKLQQIRNRESDSQEAGFKDSAEARKKLDRIFKVLDEAEGLRGKAKTKFLERNLSLDDRILAKTAKKIRAADNEIAKINQSIKSLAEFAILKDNDNNKDKKREKAKVLFEDKGFKKRRKLADRFFKRLFKANKENFKIQGELRTKDFEDTRTALQKKLELIELLDVDNLKNAQKKGEQIGGLAKGFMDAEIQAEEAKTVKINNELRDRLNNENLSAEERKKIQLKIAANDAALAKKQDKLKEKQFKIDKALAISQTLINTYATAVDVMRDTPGTFFTRLAAAVPTIAFGLAQVAMIAKQKFVPTATSAPALDSGGGATGGAAAQAPSFNIVGSSNINQLSDAISEAEKAPTRTYVVASDVSTAQELDRNIIESASL